MAKVYPNIMVVDRLTDEPINHPTVSPKLGLPLDEAYANGYTHRVASLGVFDRDGRMLLQRRGPNPMWPGLLDISVAGHVNANQTYEQNLAEEAKEEAGITDLDAYINEGGVTLLPAYHDDERFIPGPTKPHLSHLPSVSRWNKVGAILMPADRSYQAEDAGEVAGQLWFDQDRVRDMVAGDAEQFRPGGALSIRKIFEAADAGRIPFLKS